MEEWTVKERYKPNEGTLAEIRLICFTTVLSYLQSAKQGLQKDCLDVFDHLEMFVILFRFLKGYTHRLLPAYTP